jgi:hypothetical protein
MGFGAGLGKPEHSKLQGLEPSKGEFLSEPSPRLEQHGRAQALAQHVVEIPPVCTFCYSPSLQAGHGHDRLACMSCGRVSELAVIKRVRRQRIRRFIEDGTLPGRS